MNIKTLIPNLAGLIIITLLVGNGQAQKPPAPSKPKLAVSIKPQNVAEALRAVIQSDREVYTQIVAEHQRESDKAARSSAQTPSGNQLPSPCEMLRLGSQAVASKGVEFSYVLRSLQPVNQRNAPETEVETKGLQFVGTRPDLAYTSEELLGGRWYYTAVYPDVAVSQSCVACHNRQSAGTAKPFKVGDVVGALVVRIALEL